MLDSRKLYTRQVNLGCRRLGQELEDKLSEGCLENGRKLRKSNKPIKCRVKINSVWRASKEYVETTNRNRKKAAEDGSLPPEVPLEVVNHHHEHWQPYSAIIPSGGISQKGYVKEVWIECFINQVEIDNEFYNIIDPFVHDTGQWIQGFMIGSNESLTLLPSPKIVVKYFREQEYLN